MSGAAAIAAAKNRRGRPDPNKKPLPPAQTCASKSGGACPTPLKRMAEATAVAAEPTPVLKITGPTHPLIAIKIHEQRLNVLDERINILTCGVSTTTSPTTSPTTTTSTTSPIIAEHTAKIQALEKKIKGLEEMNLKLQQFVNMSIHKMNASLIKLKRAEPAVTEPALVSEPALPALVSEPALHALVSEPALPALVSEPEPALVSESEPALHALVSEPEPAHEPVTMLISELLSTTDYNAVA